MSESLTGKSNVDRYIEGRERALDNKVIPVSTGHFRNNGGVNGSSFKSPIGEIKKMYIEEPMPNGTIFRIYTLK